MLGGEFSIGVIEDFTTGGDNTGEANKICTNYFNVVKDTEDYVRSNAWAGKSEARIHTEAEAYALVHEWPELARVKGYPKEVFILSSGGYLNRVANRGPQPINKNVITTPYALGAFMMAYINPAAVNDFGTIVRSEFFSAASEFLEDTQLNQYFAGVIAAADLAYEEKLRPRLEQLEIELIPDDLPDTLDDVAPAKRPGVVRGLSKVVDDFADAESIARLIREKHEAEELMEVERKRASKAEALLEKRRRGAKVYKRREDRKNGKR